MLPGVVAARLRSLAEAMLRNSEAACFRVYCEVRVRPARGPYHRGGGAAQTRAAGRQVRRGVAERAVADLVAAPPAGEDAARVPWPLLERRIQAWILGLRQLVAAALAEHRAAAAVWPAPHAEAAFAEVVARPLAALAQARLGDPACTPRPRAPRAPGWALRRRAERRAGGRARGGRAARAGEGVRAAGHAGAPGGGRGPAGARAGRRRMRADAGRHGRAGRRAARRGARHAGRVRGDAGARRAARAAAGRHRAPAGRVRALLPQAPVRLRGGGGDAVRRAGR